MYGLSGASGRHNCLWCHIASSDLKVPLQERGHSLSRTLQTLRDDHSHFLSQGGGHVRVAKKYNNVIESYFFDIPLENVCIPRLHLSLRIYNRLWSLLGDSCNELDLKLAELHQEDIGSSTSTFSHFVNLMQQRSELTTEIENQKDYLIVMNEMRTFASISLPDAEHSSTLQDLHHDVADANTLLQTMSSQLADLERTIKKKFDINDGPFYSSLEKSLQELNVKRQAYESGTFVGNHVNKLLNPDSIKIVCGNVTKTAQAYLYMQPYAQEVNSKFIALFEAFGKCHRGVNSSVYVCESDINKLETKIEEFLHLYRSKFPWATVLPKMYILEDHTIPWLRRHHVGAGLMGEQGAESIHAHFTNLEKDHRIIVNDVDRLKYIMKEHILESAPSLTCLRPTPAKRRKTNSSS